MFIIVGKLRKVIRRLAKMVYGRVEKCGKETNVQCGRKNAYQVDNLGMGNACG